MTSQRLGRADSPWNHPDLSTPLNKCQGPLICGVKFLKQFTHQPFLQWVYVCPNLDCCSQSLGPSSAGEMEVKRVLRTFQCCWWLIHVSCLTSLASDVSIQQSSTLQRVRCWLTPCMERGVEILDHSCQDLEFITKLTTTLLLPRPCRQLNHITASMHHFSFELLMLNLSVLLRKFLQNIHLNQSMVVPYSGGRDYKMNLVGSQPVRLLHILVKSTWARTMPWKTAIVF